MSYLLEDENERGILATLTSTFPRTGTVRWIGLRTGPRAAIQVVEQVEAVPGEGLVGDRFRGAPESKRQVTFIQAEHIEAAASFMGNAPIDPALLRRNIVVKGINLFALKGKKFRVGTAVFEMTGLCYPCSRMEENLGEGGYNALRGHGGITARVLERGVVQLGDALEVLA